MNPMNWISATTFRPCVPMPTGHAGNQPFGQRRVLHPQFAEAFLQARRGAEYAAIHARRPRR